MPVADLQTLPAVLAASLGRARLLTFLLSVFAAIGVLVSVVGLYGVVALRVRQRVREIGIRMALGASPRAIGVSVLRQGVGYAAAGLAVGLPLAWLVTRLMANVLFEVAAQDPITFLLLPLLLVAVLMATCYLPARRAARVDPVAVIQAEE